MKGPYSGEPGVDWHLSKGACSFYGTPHDCRGELTFVNTSDAKVKIRSLQTQAPSRTRKECHALAPSEIAVAVRIQPRSQTCTTASMQLAPDTPPGQYQAIMLCGAQNVPVDIQVTAYHELALEPNHISVHAASGETIRWQLSLQNLGNVPLELGDVGMVWLREQNWIGRTLVYTLRETSEEETYEDFLNHLLHSFHDEMIPPARVLFEPAKIFTLGAGKHIVRNLSMTIPPGLKKGRRYAGFIKINDSRIWLELYCTGNATTPKKQQATPL